MGAGIGSPWLRPGTDVGAGKLGMTVRDRVARELRHRILLGVFRQGDRLDLDALAEEFGTSRTPVREAAMELANDDLLKVAPRSGITVRGITHSDLLDNFELMATLSGVAAGWAAERATLEDIRRMREYHDAVVTASDADGDVSLAIFDFHRCVNQSSHSSRVMALIAQTARLFPERLSEVVPSQVPCSLVEHADLVLAIEARDREKARSLMEDHFRDAAARLRQHIAAS